LSLDTQTSEYIRTVKSKLPKNDYSCSSCQSKTPSTSAQLDVEFARKIQKLEMKL